MPYPDPLDYNPVGIMITVITMGAVGAMGPFFANYHLYLGIKGCELSNFPFEKALKVGTIHLTISSLN